LEKRSILVKENSQAQFKALAKTTASLKLGRA